MTSQERARFLASRNRQRQKQRQESMVTRLADELGLSDRPDDAK
ncbi:hypothetical protein [Oxynema aestuarii]|nr:hypothetical protein [Oxynema aestuarii]